MGNYRVSPLGLYTLIVYQNKKSQTVEYAMNNCLVCGISISYQNNWKMLFIYNRVDGSGRFIKVTMHKFFIYAWILVRDNPQPTLESVLKLVNFTDRSELCDNLTKLSTGIQFLERTYSLLSNSALYINSVLSLEKPWTLITKLSTVLSMEKPYSELSQKW